MVLPFFIVTNWELVDMKIQTVHFVTSTHKPAYILATEKHI